METQVLHQYKFKSKFNPKYSRGQLLQAMEQP